MKVGDLVRLRPGRKCALYRVMRLYRGGKGGNAPRVEIMYMFSGDRMTDIRPSALEVIDESR